MHAFDLIEQLSDDFLTVCDEHDANALSYCAGYTAGDLMCPDTRAAV